MAKKPLGQGFELYKRTLKLARPYHFGKRPLFERDRVVVWDLINLIVLCIGFWGFKPTVRDGDKEIRVGTL